MTNKTIWKYDVPIEDEFVLELPDQSEVLHFAVQAGEPMLWVLVDPSKEFRECRFRLAGTGQLLPPETSADQYIGSVFQMGGQLVQHLFFLGWESKS